jgi:hypothetical protein
MTMSDARRAVPRFIDSSPPAWSSGYEPQLRKYHEFLINCKQFAGQFQVAMVPAAARRELSTSSLAWSLTRTKGAAIDDPLRQGPPSALRFRVRLCGGQTPVYVAQWGTPTTSDHFMTVQVGRAGAVVTKPVPILPRQPHWLGPIAVAPGVSAYYTESPYHGVANGQGAIKFVEHGYQSQITLGNTAPALPGLMVVAKSVAARI